MYPLKPKSLVAMIHVGALPGTPRAQHAPARLAQQAALEARALAQAGFDALLIENMHDAPYVMGRQEPAVTACMTLCAHAVRQIAPDLPLGVQVLATGNHEALAVALATGCSFIRAENFVFAHVADEGLMPTAEAGALLRYRRAIGAQRIAVLADIKKKHASHAITADLSLAQAAHGASFFGADALVITGAHTGDPTSPADLQEARRAGEGLPIVVGSGTTPANVGEMLRHADAVIVGSYIKRAGDWRNGPEAKRCAQLIKAADKAR